MAEVKITKENFQQEVMLSDKPVLLDFWADWCGPCKMLSPVIAEIAEEHPEIKVCKCNVDEESELANQFQIMSIPTVAVFKKGIMTKGLAGYMPKEMVLRLLED